MDFKEVKKVLIKVLWLNLLVAFAKIFIGLFSGALSIFTDGLHSLFDGVTNIVGLLGIKFAEKPADKTHPYGYRKYEAIASLAILFFLVITAYEISKNIFQKLLHPSTVEINWLIFGVLAGCILIDYFVARYEYRKGKELKSTILKADSSHTKSHYVTTGAVIVGAALIKLGLPAFIDPIIAAFVVMFIFKLGYQIFKETAAVLSDRAFVDADKIEKIISKINRIKSFHGIRTRGDERHIFLDFHVVLDPNISLEEAHKICQGLKEIIQKEIPEIQDVVIHLEPEAASIRQGGGFLIE